MIFQWKGECLEPIAALLRLGDSRTAIDFRGAGRLA
jgi:hypothetical protein